MKLIFVLFLIISVSYVFSDDETEIKDEKRVIEPQPAEEHSNCGDVDGSENKRKGAVKLCKKSLKSHSKHGGRKERSAQSQSYEEIPAPINPKEPTVEEFNPTPKRKNRPPPTNCDIPSRRHGGGSRPSAANSRLCKETPSVTKDESEIIGHSPVQAGAPKSHSTHQHRQRIVPVDEEENYNRPDAETDEELREEQEQNRFEFRRTHLQNKFPKVKFFAQEGQQKNENNRREEGQRREHEGQQQIPL